MRVGGGSTLASTTSSSPPQSSRPPRADRRRNRERIVAAATSVVARDGARASLEQIAREAGVGSATLHRHFPSRRALLEAVFHEHVERLGRRARDLAAEHDPGAALRAWLGELAGFAAGTRGLAVALLDQPAGMPPGDDTCHTRIHDAAAALLDAAAAAGAVRRTVTAEDLLTLVNAISLATEGDPPAARRLLGLAVTGIAPDGRAAAPGATGG